MRNVVKLFRCDMKRLFSNIMTSIIAIGLIVLPSIFAWYNILACWDVFNNTGSLSVAVANSDEGYQSDLVPIKVNIGEQVVSQLRANTEIHWVFTDEDDAIDGAKGGRYYAAVVIPPSFSSDMMTFYTGDIKHAQIVYYSNGKKNAIAPMITGQGADAISYEVNRAFAQEITKVSLALAQSLGNLSDQYDFTGRIAQLSDHIDKLGDLADQTANALGLYGSLAANAQDLIDDSTDLIANTQGSIEDIKASSETGIGDVTGSIESIEQSIDQLSQSLDVMMQSFDTIANATDALQGMPDAAKHLATLMNDAASGIDAQIKDLQGIYADISELRDAVPYGQQGALDAALMQLQTSIDLLQRSHDQLVAAADELNSGELSPDDASEKLKEISAAAKAQIAELKQNFDTNLSANLAQLEQSSSILIQNLYASAEDLDAASDSLYGAAGSASYQLGQASLSINDVVSQLHNSANELHNLSSKIDAALASGNDNALKDMLTSNVEELSAAIAAPVGIERTALFPSSSFGSSMAPLYTTLALFIGALLIMVAVKPFVTEKDIKEAHLVNPKPRQLFMGRYGVVALIALAQATLMGMGNIFFLQVDAVHPWLLMFCFLGTAIVFSFISYTLVVSFANLGKAIMVLMLIIQVTGCGGSYPLQILPWFVQAISPYLPATHVVNAMRAAMFGIYAGDFWLSMFSLALFLIPAIILGFFLRKPLENFVKFYLRKVEGSKVVG